jgi:hypothetical protein
MKFGGGFATLCEFALKSCEDVVESDSRLRSARTAHTTEGGLECRTACKAREALSLVLLSLEEVLLLLLLLLLSRVGGLCESLLLAHGVVCSEDAHDPRCDLVMHDGLVVFADDVDAEFLVRLSH